TARTSVARRKLPPEIKLAGCGGLMHRNRSACQIWQAPALDACAGGLLRGWPCPCFRADLSVPLRAYKRCEPIDHAASAGFDGLAIGQSPLTPAQAAIECPHGASQSWIVILEPSPKYRCVKTSQSTDLHAPPEAAGLDAGRLQHPVLGGQKSTDERGIRCTQVARDRA